MNTRLRLALVIVPLTVGPAWAQTQPLDLAEATLEELMNIPVVTASRLHEGLTAAPARMHVITEGQIRRRGYRSLLDVLKDLPEFNVDLAGDPDYPVQLTVQGSRGADRVIVLLDGVRVSSPTNEPLPIVANYPVHSARQIEVLYGPASAVYGADAFAAVVNIISKDAVEEPGLSLDASVGQYGIYNQSASYAARVGASGSLLLAGQFLRDQQPDLSRFYPLDFRGLQGQQTGTFNTIFGPMAAVGPVSPAYDIPMSARSLQATFRAGGLHVSLFENQSRLSTTAGYNADNAVYDRAAFYENSLLVASGGYTHVIGRMSSTSTLTVSRHELDPESAFRNVYSEMKMGYKYAYGSMVKAEEQLAWKLGTATTIVAGGTLERFFAIPKGSDLNAPIESRDSPGTILDTNIPDDFIKVRYSNAGAYAQLQHPLTARLTATVGARGDYNTRYGGTFNPRVGLVARPAADSTLKLLFGTAYLAPSPYQSYQHYGGFYSTDGGVTYASAFWHVPNPDLKPQKKQTVEASVIQGLGESYALTVSSFYCRATDTIQDSDPKGGRAGSYRGWPVAYLVSPVNEGDETIYGGSVGLDFVKVFGADARLDARAALSVADGHVSYTDDGDHLPIGGMAPVLFKAGLDARVGRWSVAPRFTVSGLQRLRATETIGDRVVRRTLDGYSTMDVNVRRRGVFKQLDVFLLVENAFDARYHHINMRAYTSPAELVGVPQNPRRVTIGLHWQRP